MRSAHLPLTSSRGDSHAGGTCLVPGFHHEWSTWIGTARGRLEIARMSRKESRSHPLMSNVTDARHQIVTPAGNAGDLLIWQNFVPHGSSTNCSKAPRMRLGVTVRPAPPPTPAYESAYFDQRETWSEFLDAAASDHRQGERDALLSAIGSRALGLTAWTDAESRVRLNV